MGKLASVVSGALGGFMAGGPWGAAAGGALGLISANSDQKTRDALANASAASQQAYNNLNPYREAGTTALSAYMQALGLSSPQQGTTSTASGAGNVAVGSVGGGGLTADEDEFLNRYLTAEASGQSRETLGNAFNLEQVDALLRKKNTAGGATAQSPDVVAQPSQSGQLNQPKSLSDILRDMPGYQFAQQEEERAIQRKASAGGSNMSGALLEELASRASSRANAASYQTYMGGLERLMSGGQNAAVGQGSIGTTLANTATNAATYRGESADTNIGQIMKGLPFLMGNKTPAIDTSGRYPSTVPMPQMTSAPEIPQYIRAP